MVVVRRGASFARRAFMRLPAVERLVREVASHSVCCCWGDGFLTEVASMSESESESDEDKESRTGVEGLVEVVSSGRGVGGVIFGR